MAIASSQYSRVTGKFQSFTGGDADSNTVPDMTSYSGSGYITCSSKDIRIVDEESSIIVTRPILVTIGTDGQLFFDDNPYVYLLAPGPDVIPSRFYYTLRLTIQLGTYITRYDKSFSVEASVPTDLAKALAVDETSSKLVTTGPRGLSMYDIAIAEGKFSGTQAEFIETYMTNSTSVVTLSPDPDNEGFFKAV